VVPDCWADFGPEWERPSSLFSFFPLFGSARLFTQESAFRSSEITKELKNTLEREGERKRERERIDTNFEATNHKYL